MRACRRAVLEAPRALHFARACASGVLLLRGSTAPPRGWTAPESEHTDIDRDLERQRGRERARGRPTHRQTHRQTKRQGGAHCGARRLRRDGWRGGRQRGQCVHQPGLGSAPGRLLFMSCLHHDPVLVGRDAAASAPGAVGWPVGSEHVLEACYLWAHGSVSALKFGLPVASRYELIIEPQVRVADVR